MALVVIKDRVIRCILLLLAFSVVINYLFCAVADGDTRFYDDFESEDLSTTGVDGFQWTDSTRISLVTGGPYENEVVWPTQTVVNDSRDWTAKNGDISMRFRYPADENMSEQRFSLGKYYTDIWFKYWIRVPTNFTHGSLNNKFFSVWVGADGYDEYGTVTWQTRPDGNGGAVLVYQDGGVNSGEEGSTQFITVPDDRGRWMEIKIHIKSATSSEAEDGIIELFRRWDGDSQWETIHSNHSADTWRNWTGPQGISHGYLMGWANDPYDIDTEWLLDDFTVYITNSTFFGITISGGISTQ